MGRIVKLINLILCFFSFYNCIAQTHEEAERINKGYEYYSQSNFVEAYEVLKEFTESDFFQRYDTKSWFYNYVFGVTLKNLNSLSQSEVYLKKSIAIAEILYGYDSYEVYNTSIHLLAVLYDLTKYKEGNAILVKLLSIESKFSGKVEDRISLLNEKVNYKIINGDYISLERDFEELLGLQKQISGEDSLSFLTLKSNLVVFYSAIEKHDLALKLQKEIVSKLEEKHPLTYQLAIDYYNLAQLELNLGFVADSEESLKKSIELQKKIIIKDDKQEALSYELLGSIYQSKGLYNKSLEPLLKAKNILNKNDSEGNLDNANVLISLAYSYHYLKENQKASELLHQVLKNYDLILSQKVNVYSLLANLYFQENDFKEAEKYYIQVAGLAQTDYDKSRIYSALSLIYSKLNKKEEALKYNKKSIDLIERLPNVDSKLFVLFHSFNTLSKYYSEEGLQETSILISENLFLKVLKSVVKFTSNEIDNMYTNYLWFVDLPLIFRNFSDKNIPQLNKNIFQYDVLVKNLSLKNQTRIRQTILEQGDQKTKELYQSYINNNNRLIRLETEFTEESIAEYKRLSEINENIEKELIKHSAEFADAQKDLQIQWTDLRDKLAPNEAIVDLVSFHLFEDDWTDKIQYAAFIVRKNSDQPEFVSLFEEKELSSLLSLQNPDSIYQSEKLYQLFIKPIENKLSGINTLYYSPSGLAHQIDFSAIDLPGDNQMLDKYKIHLLSTPAQLRKFKELALYSNSEIILYGDIDYDKESHQHSDKQLNETELHSFSDLLTRSGIGGWGYLPGTKKEVELIEHSAKEKLIKTKVYKGSEATKESLMALSGKTEPFVLHLATHGFFFENTVQELPENFLSTRSFGQMVQISENPMLRSGLVLSGANKSWHKDTSGDGIITAAEIANLDLRNCDLVVLSACDTGLGDINGSEGVYGLQRAFKLAGVKNIIMSLWKVPDEQTSEMFQLFYQELLNGKSIHQSFVEAQTKMKEKYSPYYWAGFVLLE